MPSVSKSQQRLMAMAYQVKKHDETGGREGMDPLDINPEYRREVEDLAASMNLDDLKDYAETEHKGLPDRVGESSMTGFFSAGPFPRYSSFASNFGSSYTSTERDKRDPLIKKFMEFIEGKKEEKPTDEVDEGAVLALPGVATPQNTPGMGNVTAPSPGNVGSGDKFGDDEDDEKNVGFLSYEDYKKWLKKWQKQNNQNQKPS